MARKDYQVRMESEEYGEEVFNYRTKREADRGFDRLCDEAREQKDGVERHIELIEVLRQESVDSPNKEGN
jgi:hypothetical protein